jgi:hypothetical protein
MPTNRTSRFSQQLQQLIPTAKAQFAKLETGPPYHFEKWADDRSGDSCLYYWFDPKDGSKQNHKRLIISEIESAHAHLLSADEFDRQTYRAICPKSARSGPCGFVVMGRIFEALGLARYCGREDGFIRIRPD